MTNEGTPTRMPVKPVWIHDLLILWRRNQSYALLLDRARDYAAQEIRSASVRSAVLDQIAAHFVETRGSGKAARTLQQNVWATYSRNFPAAVLAPAYWVHLTAHWPLARRLAADWGDRLAPGQVIDEALLAELPAEGAATTPDGGRPAELDVCLRTLAYFGVLAARRSIGRYVYVGRVAVAAPIFPLLVYSWWEEHGAATVALEEFARSPLVGFVAPEGFAAGWAAANGKLWTLDRTGDCARLHPTDRDAFVRGLLNLLSAGGRSGRNQPRRGEAHDDEPPETAAVRAAPDSTHP